MSLFGNLYVGNSGLQTSQNALNTVAHNMVNAETEGYTRQQVAQVTKSYNTISRTNSANAAQQVGLGVSYSEVRQVRDYFLDKSYRKESGRQGFYGVSCDAIEEVEVIFQELDGEAFANTLNNLWESVQELDKDPANTVNQGIFIQRCAEFATRSKAVYKNLEEYQSDLNYQIKQKCDEVNEMGKRIRALNEEILKIESGEVEHANDLRDERNNLIDKLSTYANISVDTDVDGNYIIQIEGVDFVTVGDVKTIDLYEDPVTGFYTPYWKQLASYDSEKNVIPSSVRPARVFNLDMEISTDKNTDIGSIKSSLLARGDHKATFMDLEDPTLYDRDIKDSVVMNVMAEFDRLIHDITTDINEVIMNYADPTTGYLIDSTTGEPFKIFEVSSTEESQKPEHASDPDAWKYDYTTNNISINERLKSAPSLLGLKKVDGIVDQECADALKRVFNSETHTLNPEVKTKTNLVNFYDNLIAQVSNTGFIMRGISSNQDITVTNIAASREQILGVSSEEELGNMVMFQNAFNASSRYINVVSELLEHIINTLGT